MKARLNKEWRTSPWVSEDRLACWAGVALLGGLAVWLWAMRLSS